MTASGCIHLLLKWCRMQEREACLVALFNLEISFHNHASVELSAPSMHLISAAAVTRLPQINWTTVCIGTVPFVESSYCHSLFSSRRLHAIAEKSGC